MGLAELLAQADRIDLLRFLACGSVDDGKSTLIGRLLHDSKMIYEDTLASLERDSCRVGSAGGAIDYSLLLDGLKAEREQGITIDVAYRYFSTPRRKFIVADCPGHEQYTRNMATGASTANLAIVLIDARHGVLPQTRRHSFIASLLDIGHLVVAVNKMDLVDWSEARFEEIREQYLAFATRLEVRDIHFIPLSALGGDNVVDGSPRTPWYRGPPLLGYLEAVHVGSDRNLIDLRFPVQNAMRQDMSFRGYQGSVASGILREGAEVVVLPSGKRTRVTGIHTYEGLRAEAYPPMAVTVTLADDVDVGRGDMLVAPNNQPRLAREIEATVVWLSETPLDPSRTYHLKHIAADMKVSVAAVRYRFDIDTLHRIPAERLALNEIGRLGLHLSRPLAFDPYRRNRATGAFILIDPITHGTVGAGMILDHEPAPRGSDAGGPRPGPGRVTAEERAWRLGQRPRTVWLTSGGGADAAAVAYALERALFDAGRLAAVIDGAADPRSAADAARMMNDAGLIAIVAFASPGADARARIGEERLHEVVVDEAVEAAVRRVLERLFAPGS